MNRTLPDKLFNDHLLRLRQQRAVRRYTPGQDKSPAFLLDYVAEDLVDRLQTVNRHFDRAVDLFGRTGTIARALSLLENTSDIIRVESEGFHVAQPAKDVLVTGPGTIGLEESSVDLVVSAFALHWMDDLPGALVEIKKALRPDGLFLAMLPGPETLKELRQCFVVAESDLLGGTTPRIDPFITVQAGGSLLQNADFALPVVDTDQVTVRYDTAFDLMHDLRSMGATNVLNTRETGRFSKKLFDHVAEIYAARFADDDGRIRATFEFVSLSGWAPHQSQQKPMKPGSAKHNLAEVLSKLR